jgi:hypothetical protein
LNYIVVLTILFQLDNAIQTYSLGGVEFKDIQSCNSFINEKKQFLEGTVKLQFNQNTQVKDYAIECMTYIEYDKYIDSLLKI